MKNEIKTWWEKRLEEAQQEDYYFPKKTGDLKAVSFENDGLAKTYCTVTEWSSGEGFDISFETKTNFNTWENKHISLHHDELECMLACLLLFLDIVANFFVNVSQTRWKYLQKKCNGFTKKYYLCIK